MINASLTTSNVPADFKHAIVKPLLKKPTLDKDILQTYRPVSNLPFVSNLVAKQISTHVDENALRDPFQFAYRRGHSTETALFRIKNYIAAALDRKCTTILVMLDLSCAFDTVDHELLMTRLEDSFGISDKALAWLQSYISERYQKVAEGSAESVDSILTCGVPQGSVLGPALYYMYNKPIGDIVARHGMQYHCYADDTQIYLTVERDEFIVVALKVALCIAEVAAWLNKNLLKLNREERDSLPADVYITVAGHRIQPSSCVRNLGVQFDSNLKMEHQIANTVKSCYYQIRNIGRIRLHLTEESYKTLVHALVTSRLDYGNALLYNLPQTALQRLQKVENGAARLITHTRKYEHSTPVLQRLHWLPVHLRPTYKVFLLTYCALNGLAPDYLADLISYRPINRTLYDLLRCQRFYSYRLH